LIVASFALISLIWTFNCRFISLFISRVMIIRLKTEWASNILEAWLWSSFLISNIQESAFSSLSLVTMKKKYSMCLLLSWRRFCSVHSCDFLSRSQINHALHLIFNLNFFVRFSTIAYSSLSTCSFRKRSRSSKSSKVRSSKGGDRIIVIERWDVSERWDEVAEFSKYELDKQCCLSRSK
jgi:hypothetical protein